MKRKQKATIIEIGHYVVHILHEGNILNIILIFTVLNSFNSSSFTVFDCTKATFPVSDL